MQSKSPPGELRLLLETEERAHSFELSRRGRVSIGRHESNDVRLASLTVSNFHAELVFDDEVLILRDLGSTNGTDLNGTRVERASVTSGDRVRVGNHFFSVTLNEGAPAPPKETSSALGPGARGRILPSRAAGEGTDGDTEERRPSELSLPELLRELSSVASPVQVSIERTGARGLILIESGSVIHAEIGPVSGEKALYRLFGWREATYEIDDLEDPDEAPISICLPLEALLEAGVDHALELGKVVARLPPLGATLTLKEDCPLPLTEHSHAEIEVFQQIIRYRTIENILTQSPYTDLRVLRLIASLLSKGVFDVGSERALHDTHQWDTANLLGS